MHKCQAERSVDKAIELLRSNCRRRLVRRLIDEQATVVDIEELAQPLQSELDKDLQSIKILLAHHHLPKLADDEMIEYDHRSGSVRPTSAVEELAPLLEACEEFQRDGV